MRTINTHMKKPCSNCPFRMDSMAGWLGAERMEEIVSSDSFTCHKTTHSSPDNLKQCAGHMILADFSTYVQLADRLGIDLQLTGKELIFKTAQEVINHHK